jgi:hypothetical protein
MALVCKLLAVLPHGRSLKALGGHPTRLHNEGHNGGRCGQVVRSLLCSCAAGGGLNLMPGTMLFI